MERYFNSDWFLRLWVVQEAALASKNTCYRGKTECSLDDILKAGRWLLYKCYHLPPALYSGSDGSANACRMFEFCDQDIGRFASSQTKSQPLDILESTGDFRASEARDRIFAALGLAKMFIQLEDAQLDLLRPNYHKSISNVFTDATRYCVLERKDLFVLTYINHRCDGPTIAELPSWVPVWDQNFVAEVDAHLMQESLFWASSRERVPMLNIRPGLKNSLVVSGFIITTATKCSMLLDKEAILMAWRLLSCEAVRCVFNYHNAAAALPETQDFNDLAMVLTGGIDHTRRRWTRKECLLRFEAYEQTVANNTSPTLDDSTENSPADERLAAQFHAAMNMALRNRRIFTADFAHLGLGPQTMEPGNIVTILLGHSVPAVLRKTSESSNEFHFIGGCYMYGIMDGEAVEEHRRAGMEDDKFVLV